mgnify:CR=1 FL=1
MSGDAIDPEKDPFYPPEIPTLVGCLHCGQEYESYLIEWRVRKGFDGKQHGCWCCPTEGCDGIGFGFDILPVDQEFEDERGGIWIEASEEESELDSWQDDSDEDPKPKRDRGDEELPW